jgi:hypothetical protein
MPGKRPSAVPEEWSLKWKRSLPSEVRSAVAPQNISVNRTHFPKKTDLSAYSKSELYKVAMRLNQRPGKTLGFQTPAGKLQAGVESTG